MDMGTGTFEDLRRRSRRNARDKRREKDSYRDLVAAIWAAADQGMPQVDIVRAVGLTRERIRVICLPDYRARHAAGVLGARDGGGGDDGG